MSYPNKIIYYKNVPENHDYILINVKHDLLYLIREGIPNEIYSELQSIYYGLLQFEQQLQRYISEDIAIRKDSLIGSFILLNKRTFIPEDEITYKKVVNAYNIAVFKEDNHMANKILPLFKERVSGSIEELSKIYSSDILLNILENENFEEYLKMLDGKKDKTVENKKEKEYVIYENGGYTKRKLGDIKEEYKVKESN